MRTEGASRRTLTRSSPPDAPRRAACGRGDIRAGVEGLRIGERRRLGAMPSGAVRPADGLALLSAGGHTDRIRRHRCASLQHGERSAGASTSGLRRLRPVFSADHAEIGAADHAELDTRRADIRPAGDIHCAADMAERAKLAGMASTIDLRTSGR